MLLPLCLAFSSGAPRSDARGSALRDWASSRILTSPSFALASFPPQLHGVLATSPVVPSSLLVQLPRALTLQLRAVNPPPPSGVSPVIWEAAPWYAQMAMLLLHARAGGGGVDLSAYIDALPREFDTPLHWSEEELEELQAPLFKRRVVDDRRTLHQLHEWAVEVARSLRLQGPL